MPAYAQDEPRGAAVRAEAERLARRRDVRSATVALAIASLQMIVSMPVMAHGHGMAPWLAAPETHPLLRWTLLVSTLYVMVLARATFVRAWAALRQGAADVSALVALGSATAFVYSAAATLAPARFVTEGRLPDVHFEAASFLLAFVLLGRALGGRDTPAPVEGTSTTRAPARHLADRASAYLAPRIVIVACLAAIAWAALGPEPRLIHAIATFVAVVVVSCPPALGLATPVAIAIAIGRTAQLGVRVRSGDALERAAAIDTLVLDTTGMLTDGEPEIVRFVVVPSAGAPADGDAEADAVLRMAAAVERGSEHPVGQAIVREAEELALEVPAAARLVASAGAGARAEVEGHDVRVGAIAWLASEGVRGTEGTTPEAAFGVAIDGVMRGFGVVADRLRDDASDAIARLRALGVRVVVLSGDRTDVARAVAAELGVDEVEAELGSEGKRDVLDRLAREGRRVAMCGDGVNDAPALARAHLGIALGTDATLDTSDVTLLAGGLRSVPDMLELARRSRRVIRQNLAWAFVYNLALVPIAAGALVPSFGLRMTPALTSAVIALSTLSVVLSSLRLRHFEASAPALPGTTP